MINPCKGVCTIENGMCKGCKRTEEEIVDWWDYDDEEQMRIFRELRDRKLKKPKIKRFESFEPEEYWEEERDILPGNYINIVSDNINNLRDIVYYNSTLKFKDSYFYISIYNNEGDLLVEYTNNETNNEKPFRNNYLLYFMKFIVNDNYGRLIMNAKSSMSIDLFIYVEDRDLNNLNENDIKIIREVLIDNGIAPHLVNEFMDSIKHNRPHWLQR